MVPGEGVAPSLSAYETALLLLKYPGMKWRRVKEFNLQGLSPRPFSRGVQSAICLTLRKLTRHRLETAVWAFRQREHRHPREYALLVPHGDFLCSAVFPLWHLRQRTWHLANSLVLTFSDRLHIQPECSFFALGSTWSTSRFFADPHLRHGPWALIHFCRRSVLHFS